VLRRTISAGELLLPVCRRLLATASLSFLLISTAAAFAQGGPPAMPVSVAAPIAKRVTQWDEFSGRFEAVASVEVRARVSGFIEELHFKDGQLVKVGDPLFTIDKRPYEIAVDSAKADVARNKAQVGLAELQVQRGASLITSRTITEQENDQRKANLEVAKAQLKAAEAAQRSADRRPHLRPQGRCRQPDPGRPAGRHPARHHRHPRSDSLRVRCLGIGLSALHASLPVGRNGLLARDQSCAHSPGR
jgi:hypothetical protein